MGDGTQDRKGLLISLCRKQIFIVVRRQRAPGPELLRRRGFRQNHSRVQDQDQV